MSAKWQRSKAWDDHVIPRWAWPVKFVLRALSSIPLAVVLLSLVGLYGVIASVPIGMLVQIPTYLVYALTAIVAVGAIGVMPVLVLRRVWKDGSPAMRFSVTLITGIMLTITALLLWGRFAWPMLRWDPATSSGLRFFPEFCAQYAATTLRRLPALEMSELEFYAWWPLRLVLILFVANMAFATLRRIEFRFPNLGVLMVHSGIITLALGSMYYSTLKEEGDTVLLSAAQPGTPGPPVGAFFDNTRVALWVSQHDALWEQRPLADVPRYNDYGVPWSNRPLDLPVPPAPAANASVDPDIRLRIVGYASYADLKKAWIGSATQGSGVAGALIDAELVSSLSDQKEAKAPQVVADMHLAAGDPASRTAELGGAMGVEHVPASQAERWKSLSVRFPEPGDHALALSAPGWGGEPVVFVVQPGKSVEAFGHRILVKELLPSVPFPIITPGYSGAESAVAVLEITPQGGAPYERYVYHRFPELDQDVTGTREDGRPIRRPADPAIRIAYLDASMLQVYLRSDGPAIVRMRGGNLYAIENAQEGGTLSIAPNVGLRVAKRWPAATRVEQPVNVPESARQRDNIGTHNAAAIAVEVSLPSGWKQTLWVPFAKYMGLGGELERSVTLPDARTITLGFGRLSHSLPGIALQLVDFEMIPYPHGDIPRDYVSEVKVTDMATGDSYLHSTRLNTPLIHRAAFKWSEDRPAPANVLGELVSLVAPNQYKFSQAGWDVDGWRQTLQETKEGKALRPRASFTILGVGNNPGIYIVAAGGVLMSIGIPWAFYVKPWIVRRRKVRIQRGIAEMASALDAEESAGEALVSGAAGPGIST